MDPQKKLTHRQTEAQQEIQTQHGTSQANVRDFATVEELLREDARNTKVPAGIGERIQRSLDKLPGTEGKSWWRRLFGA